MNDERGQGSSEDPLGPYPMASCISEQKQGRRGEVGATGAAKRGTLRGETEEPGDTQVGTLYRCPSVWMSHLNGHRESGARQERCVGAARLKVEVVSLAEWNAGRGGSDLPNRAGQVIGWMRNGKSCEEEGMWCGNEGGGSLTKLWDLIGTAGEAEGEGTRREGNVIRGQGT